jgi:hypothetical protein
MFSWSQSLRAAVLAARRNFWPGLFLQALLLLFLAAYLWHEPTQKGLATVAGWKQEAGFLFAAFSFLLASAFLPELLRVLFFQKGRLTRQNWWNFLTSTPLWMGMGVLIDLFYRLQLHLFGDGSDWAVLLPKVLVDQFLFSPFIAQPIIVCYLTWRDARYATSVWPGMLRLSFYLEKVLPLQVAAWCLWIPGVTLVYFMEPLLQIPTAVLIQAFWVLILTTLRRRDGGAPG